MSIIHVFKVPPYQGSRLSGLPVVSAPRCQCSIQSRLHNVWAPRPQDSKVSDLHDFSSDDILYMFMLLYWMIAAGTWEGEKRAMDNIGLQYDYIGINVNLRSVK